jgi:hypothetical protein
MTGSHFSTIAWLNRRDGERALLALLCLVCAIAFAIFVQPETTHRTASAANPAPQATPSDEEIYTGSIVFVPIDGNECQQNLIDNLTGRIWDNGIKPCETALARGGTVPRAWSAARIDAVRGGFRKQ